MCDCETCLESCIRAAVCGERHGPFLSQDQQYSKRACLAIQVCPCQFPQERSRSRSARGLCDNACSLSNGKLGRGKEARERTDIGITHYRSEALVQWQLTQCTRPRSGGGDSCENSETALCDPANRYGFLRRPGQTTSPREVFENSDFVFLRAGSTQRPVGLPRKLCARPL